MRRTARLGAVVALVCSAGTLGLAPDAVASCGTSGPPPYESVQAGDELALHGSVLLDCRDVITGTPNPPATAPPTMSVHLVAVAVPHGDRVIGHVSTVRVARPRSVTPTAVYEGTVTLPHDVEPGRYTLEIRGEAQRQLRVVAVPPPAPTPPELPNTGIVATLLLGIAALAGLVGAAALVGSRLGRAERRG